MILRNLSAAASALALAACAVGPDYKAPQSASAPAATGAFVSANSPAVSLDPVAADWWRLYDDPVLDGLAAYALANKHDLRVALTIRTEAPRVGKEGVSTCSYRWTSSY